MRPGRVSVLAAFSLAVLSVTWHPSVAAPPPGRPCAPAMAPEAHASVPLFHRSECRQCLRAGAASVDITPPLGVPLAGYGGFGRRPLIPNLLNGDPYTFWFKASRGVDLPIMARALVLERGDVRVLWLSVDLVAIDARLVAARDSLGSSPWTASSLRSPITSSGGWFWRRGTPNP